MNENHTFNSTSRALIIGASGGIGSALPEAINVAYGITDIVKISRSDDGLDITNEDSIKNLFESLDGEFELIFVTTGALEINGIGPEKTILQMTPENLRAHFEINTLGPALLIKHLHKLLPKERRSILVILTARVGSIGDNNLGGWISYRTSKAAVHQIIRTSALEIKNKFKKSICIALHPGTVKTNLTQKYVGNHPSVSPDQAAKNILNVINSLSQEDTGNFFDWAGKKVEW
ncbi:SDR family oxidoreductase [Amylibacter sp.]|nr:SDR family oxidoreductase [Amylibacter sp.]